MNLGDWVGTVVLVALMIAGLVTGLRHARHFRDPADRKRDTNHTS